MAVASTCLFLSLPQELRDHVYTYALGSDRCSTSGTQDLAPLLEVLATPSVLWKIGTTPQAPIATYLSLMFCCHQLLDEMETFLTYSHDPEGSTAKLTLALAYPNATARWSCVPRPPHQLQNLDITLKMSNIFHPATSGPGLHEIFLRPVFEVLKRYIHFGPHLARQSPLPEALKLTNIRITIVPAISFDDMTFVYGNPAQQLAMLAGRMKRMMERLARSGLLFGVVNVLEMRLLDEEWSRMPVTSNVWDEQDYVLFQDLGFRWNVG
ncbi:hypothetical protein LTR85_003674 [Meristemomyces frigidus]|nr:hypothetical protein LTR85_003674 [Meristemomyces frigidus]